MKKWFISQNKFFTFKGRIWIIPSISIWYQKYTFLETGVGTPAFGIQFAWLRWSYNLSFQLGY